MYRVVQTHDQFNRLGVEVAGKTGTAEIDYYHPNNALFIGYAPVSDPKYAISVRIANGYASGNPALQLMISLNTFSDLQMKAPFSLAMQQAIPVMYRMTKQTL